VSLADNPAEEVNMFDVPGRHYGYPYCFSEFSIPKKGHGPKTQWGWPGGIRDDAWCQTKSNNEPPIVAMQAHSAPLGIVFYGKRASERETREREKERKRERERARERENEREKERERESERETRERESERARERRETEEAFLR
jgi:hypothetical protein